MKPLLALLLLSVTAFADDSAKLIALLAKDGVVTIPAGDYLLEGTQTIPLRSNTTVMAHGARFILPETLPDQARVVLFAGENIAHFAWHGGEFIGQELYPVVPVGKQSNKYYTITKANWLRLPTSTLRAPGRMVHGSSRASSCSRNHSIGP
jgi:hypothetical protein